MSDLNQLNLFGLDLSRFYRRALLAFNRCFGAMRWVQAGSLRSCYHRLEDIDETANVAWRVQG